jgi:hypothetical protein
MQVIHSGDRLWNAASRKPLEALELSEKTRDLLRRGLFVEPVPEASRVVFIATPHRGTFIAAWQIVANLVRKLVSFRGPVEPVGPSLAGAPVAAGRL